MLRNASDRIIGRPNGRVNDGYFAQEQRLESATIIAIRSVVSRVRDSGCEIILPASKRRNGIRPRPSQSYRPNRACRVGTRAR